MKHPQAPLLAALLCVPWLYPAAPPQEPANPKAAADQDSTALEQTRDIVRFYSLATDRPDLDAAADALEALGAGVIYGPQTAPRRKGLSFVAVRTPSVAPERDLEKALRRAGGAAKPLRCTVFDGATPPFGPVADHTLDDHLMWLESAAWIDHGGTRTQLYCERGPSAKEAHAIVERWTMMYEGNVRLGEIATETHSWELESAPDATIAARVLRDVKKLAGVTQASFEGARLSVTVQLLALDVSGLEASPAASGRPDPQGRHAPRVTWSKRAVDDLLAAQRLLVAAPGDPARK